MKIVKLKKECGETPLFCLKKYLSTLKEGENKSEDLLSGWTYLGRLDPLASGLLLVAKDIDEMSREKFLSLEKEYRFEVLYGFKTDTADVLGLITDSKDITNLEKPNVDNFLGKREQVYPMYSSKPVSGKPLFWWARQAIKPEKMPTKEIKITKLIYEKRRTISAEELINNIRIKINSVKGDFRQEQILEKWNKILLDNNSDFFVDSFSVVGSGGLYVRSLSEAIGKSLSVPALAFTIERLRIGSYHLD